jgi:hypothetical protein
MTSGEKIIFYDLINCYDVRISIELDANYVGNIDESNLVVTYYNYDKLTCHDNCVLKYYPPTMHDNNYKYPFMNIINQIQLNTESVSNMSNSGLSIQTRLNFNHVTTDLFFMFTNDKTGEIVRHKMFDECVLSIDGQDKNIDSFISLRHKSNENNCDDGVYWLQLEGIQRNDIEYQTYPNLSKINNLNLSLNSNSNYNLEGNFTLSVYAISRNCLIYFSKCDISGTGIMYTN